MKIETYWDSVLQQYVAYYNDEYDWDSLRGHGDDVELAVYDLLSQSIYC